MNESQRLLEGLALERLSPEEALREIKRIASRTLRHMSSGYYVARMEAIRTLIELAEKDPRGSHSRSINS